MRLRTWMALGLLIAAPAVVFAQAVVQDGSSFRQNLQGQAIGGILRADSTFKLFTMDATGNLSMLDAFPNRTANVIWSNAINDTISPPATPNALVMAWSAESTATLDVSTLHTIGLFFRFIPGAPIDSTATSRFAIQIRAHPVSSQDSASTFIWRGFNSSYSGTGTDSVGHALAAFVQQQTDVTSRGEFVLQFPHRHYSGASQIPLSGQTGTYIVLTTKGGEPFWAPYMSIRVRLMTPSTSAGKPRVRLDIVGTPL